MRFGRHSSGDIYEVILTKEELLGKAPKYYFDMDSADLEKYDEFVIVNDGCLYGIANIISRDLLLDADVHLREYWYERLVTLQDQNEQ